MAATALLAYLGYVTGGGPKDRRLRDEMTQGGWQPYSFHVGGTYFPFRPYEPWGGILGMAADTTELLFDKAPEAERRNFFAGAFEAMTRDLMAPSYLLGLSEAMKYVADPAHASETFARETIGSYVPNVLRRLASAINPERIGTTRKEGAGALAKRLFVETPASRIPGLPGLFPESLPKALTPVCQSPCGSESNTRSSLQQQPRASHCGIRGSAPQERDGPKRTILKGKIDALRRVQLKAFQKG